MSENKLQTIFDDDDLGILDIKAISRIKTETERLIDSFEEINDFYQTNNCEPKKNESMNEMQLASRLKGLRNNIDKATVLIDFDVHNLLESYINPPKSIDDILNSNADILEVSSGEEAILTLKNIPERKNKSDFIATRKPCINFKKYKDGFKDVQKQLLAGNMRLIDFVNVKQLQEYSYYVSDGILLYVDGFGKQKEVHGRMKERTRCIFENGTESNMYLRSLSSQLYEGGKEVVKKDYIDKNNEIEAEDKKKGIIYVIKSLSNDIKLQKYQNLCKVGFTRSTINERVKNATNDPTFLMAPVKVLATYECYNLKAAKLENLLHRFFNSVRLDLVITDSQGDEKEPSEWFDISLNIVDQAINLMIDGEIVNYVYNNVSGKIELKNYEQ